MNAIKTYTESLASLLMSALDYIRPDNIARRMAEASLAEHKHELSQLAKNAQIAMFDAEDRHMARLEEIKQIAQLREAELKYLIHRAGILLGEQ